MSKNRIAPEAGWVNPTRLPKGPNGRALCRKCGQEVPKGCRTFCSEACVHEHKLRTNPGYVRKQVFQRDRGVCHLCGLDTVTEEQRLALEVNSAWRTSPDAWAAAKEVFLTILGAKPGSRNHGGYWDADHIVPVSLDGGGCGLDNYRTLCIPCHKQATASLRKQLSRDRRAQEKP
jgi:5-methylcytosine-specific restriction protein A